MDGQLGARSPFGRRCTSSSFVVSPLHDSSTAMAPSSIKGKDKLPSSGYLITCDIPTKQFIQHLNDTKPLDKKFIIKDLDSNHLLVKHKAKAEIARKVDDWMNENVFSHVERLGDDLDTS